jgi:hypothetical protein
MSGGLPARSPRVGALAALLHELVHAEADSEAHHRGAFIRTARPVGLVTYDFTMEWSASAGAFAGLGAQMTVLPSGRAA